MTSDEEAEREAWDGEFGGRFGLPSCYWEIFQYAFRAGLAHARSEQAKRIAALERVADAAREVDQSSDPVEYKDALDRLHDALIALDPA